MLSLMRYANSVDVLGDDGLMRYGRVVDVAEGGLFVDLLYPNRRREIVPVNRLFLPSETSYPAPYPTDSEEFSTSVEVLMPESPSGVLIWLPGETVSLGPGLSVEDYGGAMVHWRRKDTGVSCTDFFPLRRIRWPKPLAYREAEKGWRSLAEKEATGHDGSRSGYFVKCTVQLDDDLRSVSSDEAEELFKRLNDSELRDFPFRVKVDVVELVGGRLGYVYQRDYREAYGVYDPKGGWFLASLARFQAELLRLSSLSDEIPTSNDKMALRMELWQEVFSYLDTMTQMKLRAVCTLWNWTMDTPGLRGCVLMARSIAFGLWILSVGHR